MDRALVSGVDQGQRSKFMESKESVNFIGERGIFEISQKVQKVLLFSQKQSQLQSQGSYDFLSAECHGLVCLESVKIGI